jgi:hypothetical protein
MPGKTSQLQIRVTARQKAALRKRAAAAGLDVSAFVLARALPPEADRFGDLVGALASASNPAFALADLNDFLTACPPAAFGAALEDASVAQLSPLHQNYVAAMVEQAAQLKRVAPPAWTREIVPLPEPHFATPLKSLRTYLLGAAPIAFKRRNLFVDATVGDRV